MKELIFEKDGEWFFWDETWTYAHGPYESYEETEKAQKRYCEWLATGK
jgi:hypothetical protein